MATYLITRFNHFDCYLDNHSTKLSTIKYNTKMKATGERMIPKIEDGTYFEHLHRYAFADEFVNNKIVLDIANMSNTFNNIFLVLIIVIPISKACSL